MTAALILILAFADIGSVKAEPDLNKRSELALENADSAIDTARKASEAGDERTIQAALGEVEESASLCYDSLEQTHATPRKSRYYKRAELKISALLRRLNSLRDQVGYETRPAVEAAIKKLSDVHDQLLQEIMSKHK